jgi:hypothetical protein
VGARVGSLSKLSKLSNVSKLSDLASLASATAKTTAPDRTVRLEAAGNGTNLVLTDDKLVIDQTGVGCVVRRAAEIYKQGPAVLATALAGPNRQVLVAALADNRDLAKVLFAAARHSGDQLDTDPTGDLDSDDLDTEDTTKLAKRLVEAFRRNRSAMIAAVRTNDDLVKEWMSAHKDLLGIFLQGDVHLFVEDVEDMQVVVRRGEGVCRMNADGETLAVKFDPAKQADFEAIQTALGFSNRAAGAAEIAPAAIGSARDTKAGPDTKACPMCAEDIKTAAKLCRFCGHQFTDE